MSDANMNPRDSGMAKSVEGHRDRTAGAAGSDKVTGSDIWDELTLLARRIGLALGNDDVEIAVSAAQQTRGGLEDLRKVLGPEDEPAFLGPQASERR
jgi:hypothetical protein